MRIETLNAIKAAGFDVYMRHLNDGYCYFSDGKGVGCFSESYFFGFNLSTVHLPNRNTGTGFRIESECTLPISRELLQRAFALAPSWHHGEFPRKYPSLEAFLNADSWNKKLVKV